MFDVVRNSLTAMGLTVCLMSGSIAVWGQQQQPAQPLTEAQRQALRAQHQAELEKEYQRHPTLAIGAQAPDFNLPGVDGRKHRLSEYSKYPILAIVFTCDHCPTAQLYEGRIKKLVADYGPK